MPRRAGFGPGLADGNFVLTEFTCEVGHAARQPRSSSR